MRLSDANKARLNDLIDKVVASFGDRSVTVAQVVQQALADARAICEDQYDFFVSQALGPMVRRKFAQPRGYDGTATAEQHSLPFEFALPDRIAVPTAPDSADEEIASWPRLVRATVGELQRNLDMRDKLITGAQAERDKLYTVLREARALGASDDDILGEVFKRAKKKRGGK